MGKGKWQIWDKGEVEGNYESIVIVGIHEEIIRVIVLNTSKLNQTLKEIAISLWTIKEMTSLVWFQ